VTLLGAAIVLTWLAAIVAGAMALAWLYNRFGD